VTRLVAEWLARPETQAIFAALDGAAGRTRAVGGVVRDTLLDRLRPDSDIDLATQLLPNEVIARAKAAGIAHYPTGIEHGTVTLRLGASTVEVTTLRQDVATDGRHAQVAFGTDWVADASRRDFTLNALYCFADGELFDPLGGAGDAEAGRVRFIGNARSRIAEDGLRVYRFFRFSASHGSGALDPDGLAACAEAAGALEHISAERVGSEMLRMLALPQIAPTLRVMARIGLIQLHEAQLGALLAYETFGGRNPAARLALVGARQIRQPWRLSNTSVAQAEAINSSAALAEAGRVAEAAYRHGELAVDGLAVAAARNGWSRDRLAEEARLLGRVIIPDFPVTGHDLTGLGFVPGPALGQQLARLERAWIDSGFTLSKAELLSSAAPSGE
jgi:poly(A) polymerase